MTHKKTHLNLELIKDISKIGYLKKKILEIDEQGTANFIKYIINTKYASEKKNPRGNSIIIL